MPPTGILCCTAEHRDSSSATTELRRATVAGIKPRIAPFRTHGLPRRLRINPLVRNGTARGPGEQPPRGLSLLPCAVSHKGPPRCLLQVPPTNGGRVVTTPTAPAQDVIEAPLHPLIIIVGILIV